MCDECTSIVSWCSGIPSLSSSVTVVTTPVVLLIAKKSLFLIKLNSILAFDPEGGKEGIVYAQTSS